jgi:rubredoxin
MRDGSDTAFLSASDPTSHTVARSERLTEDRENNELTLTHQDIELDFTSVAKDQLYRCSFCSRLFSSEQGRRLHCRRMHEGAKMLTFFYVSNDDNTVNPPNMKVASSTKDGPFECSFCSSVFNNEKGLKIHSAENHRNELLHVRSVESLNGVMNPEEPSGTLCNVCNRTFDSEEARILHFSKNHADSLTNTMIIPAFST